MKQTHLKDFRPEIDDSRPISQSKSHQEEISTLRIDKLSNRITIISIIIPCLIGAILFFAYMDMKEKVVEADTTKQNQVSRISEQFDSKLNALDIKIAKNRFDIENEFPKINAKTTQIEGLLAKTTASMADKTEIQTELNELKKKITDNTNQNKTNIQTIEQANQTALSVVKESEERLTAQMNSFKKQFSDKMTELTQISEQLAQMKKQLSIVDIRQKDLESKYLDAQMLENKINETKTLLLKNLQVIQENIENEIKNLDQKILNNTIQIQNPRPISSNSNTDPAKSGVIIEEIIAD